jgi:protein-S-isoprenylcysteine O-methyltransferase Ste14
MRPIPFIWPEALIFWIVYAWAFVPEFGILRRAERANRAAPRSQDSHSLRVIMLGMWLGLLIAFPLSFRPQFAITGMGRIVAYWGGTALLLAGSLLRRHCWRTLGRYFTGNVQTVEQQQVIDKGAYAYVRHPSYTAGVMMFTGIGFALGNWASVAVTFVSAAAVYAYRVRIEERALVEALGAPYVEYMKTRKRFVPFLL